MELLPVGESACYRCHPPRIGEIEPFRSRPELQPMPSRWPALSPPDQAWAGTFASHRALRFAFECLMSRSICRSMNIEARAFKCRSDDEFERVSC